MSGTPKLVKIIVPSSFVTHKPIFGIKNSNIVVPLARSEYLTINLNIKKMFDPTTDFKLDDYGLKPKNMKDNTLINTKKRTTLIPDVPSKYALVKKDTNDWDFVTENDVISDIFIFKNYVKDVENTDKKALISWLAQGDDSRITTINDLFNNPTTATATATALYKLLDNDLFTDEKLVKQAFDKITAINAADASAVANSINKGTIVAQPNTETVNPLTAGFVVTCEQKTLNNNFDLNEITIKYVNPTDPSKITPIINLLVPINLTGTANTIQAYVTEHLKFILDFLYIFKDSPNYNELIEKLVDKTTYVVEDYDAIVPTGSTGSTSPTGIIKLSESDISVFVQLIFPKIQSLLKSADPKITDVLGKKVGNVNDIKDFGKVIICFKAYVTYIYYISFVTYYIAKLNLQIPTNDSIILTAPSTATTAPTQVDQNGIITFINKIYAADALAAAAAPAAATALAVALAAAADADAAAAADAANNIIEQLKIMKKYIVNTSNEIIAQQNILGGGYSISNPKKRRNRGKQSKRKRVRRRMTEKREV